MKQILVITSFLFLVSFGVYGQTVTPTTIGCGQTPVTIDWGCDWDGEVTIFDFLFPTGVSLIGSSVETATAGIVSFDFNVTSSAPASFPIQREISFIAQNTAGCGVADGDPVNVTMMTNCPAGPTVTVSPTTLGCGSNTLTIDYGTCGWTGSATVSDNDPNVTYPNGTTVTVNNGIGTIVLDVATGTIGDFDLTITTGGIDNNPGGCMHSGPPPFSHVETITADCPAPCTLTASATVDQDESCSGSNDGAATASGSGGSGNYGFLWNDTNGQTTATATGLAPGSYMVTAVSYTHLTLPTILLV